MINFQFALLFSKKCLKEMELTIYLCTSAPPSELPSNNKSAMMEIDKQLGLKTSLLEH